MQVSTPPDFSFMEVVSAHGWRRLAPFIWHDETKILERVEELSDRAVVRLHMRENKGCVDVEVEGRGDEVDILARVSRMLQIGLSLENFHSYCRANPILSHIAECNRGRMLRSSTLYEDTVKVIATANTTWAQTISMVSRLVEHFGAPLPHDPAAHAFPTPARIAAVPFEEFAAKARMGYRNASVYSISTQIAEGQLDLESWQNPGMDAQELRKRMLCLPGIGPYGAACLMLYLGVPEQVNADSVARAHLTRELGRAVNDKEVQAFFERYGKWRGLVYNFYPWKKTESGSES